MRMLAILAALGVAVTLVGCGQSQQDRGKQTSKPAGTVTGVDRTVLPIAEPDYPRATELDARRARVPPGLSHHIA